jgi:hypothetical protein
MSKYFKKFWPFLAFLFIFLGIFNKIFSGLLPFPGDLLTSFFFPYNSGGWVGYSTWITHKEFIAADVVRQIFPWRDLAIGIFKSGQIPLWNPYAFSGYPLLANIQSAVFYPLNIIFFVFNTKMAWIVYVLSQPVLAFIFMYLFIRSISLSKYAALFCGLSFGFVGYMANWFEWGVVGHSAIWLPLILYGITKYFKNNSPKFLVLSSIGLACSVFAGHIQTTTYVGIVTFLYYVFCTFSKENNFLRGLKSVMRRSWFILLALGITCVQILPSLELLQLSARNVPESVEIFHRFQLPYSHLLTFFAPDFFGNPGVGNAWQDNYAEFMAYFGIVTLVFSTIGCLYQRKNKLIGFLLILSGVCLLFALPTPFSEALLKFKIPVLNTSSPARILFIIQFSFVVLAGFGIDFYFSRKNFVWKSFFLLMTIYAGMWIFVFVAPYFQQLANIIPHLSVIKRNLAVPTITLVTTFILIYIGIKNNKFKILTFLLFLIIAGFEYQYFLYKFSPFSPFKYFFPAQQLLSHLQEITPPDRIYGYGVGRIDTNLPTQLRLYSPEGYDSLYIKRYGELINASYPKSLTRSDALLPNNILPTDDSHAKQVLMNLMDIKYIIFKNDLAPKKFLQQAWMFPLDRFKLIYQVYKWQVLENLNSIPRANVFHDFTMEKDSNKIIQMLFDKNFPYSKKLVLEEPVSNFFPNRDALPTQSKIIYYKPNEIKIQTDTETDGLLFLSDNYYPGWHASVDNVPTKIYRADYAFKAIPVKAGRHIIYLNYMPKSFIYGAIISGISLFVAFLILMKKGSRKD